MADENTGTGDRRDGVSKPNPQNIGLAPTGAQSAPVPVSAPVPEPEPVILEETITRPATPKADPPPKPPVPPSPSAPPQVEKPPEPPLAPPLASPTAKVAPIPSVKPAAPAPAKGIVFMPPEKPMPPPVQAPPPPPPAAPAVPAITPGTRTPVEFAKEQEAIANILKEIKLPERRMEAPQKDAKKFDTALGAAPRAQAGTVTLAPSTATATVASAPAKQSEGLASSIVSPLRTLKNDLQKIIRVNKISLVRAAALESQKHRGGAEEEREAVREVRSRRSLGILFATALFVVLGAAAFFGVFFIMGERSAAPSENPQSTILFAENGVPFPLDNTSSIDLKRLLAQARAGGGGTLGSITRIIPTLTETTPEGVVTERAAALEEFLKALGTRVPEELLRALPNEFFFGIHTVDENAPLFVIPVVSYERAFAGMLRWEETLNADLSPAFTPVPDQTLGAGGLPEKRRFEDVVMRNYDVRVLKDDAGAIELYYSFPTRELLVIAESPYSFTEILSRLRAERKL